ATSSAPAPSAAAAATNSTAGSSPATSSNSKSPTWAFCAIASEPPSRRACMFPLSKGKVTPQAHVGIPEGTYEEEHARKGFFGKTSHLYRAHRPTDWTRIEGPLRPHAYYLSELAP